MANILVVDDSAIMRINIRSILAEAGHNVVSEAENAIQAFYEYQKFRPDLVTMDINMPGTTGIEATKKILSSHPDAKIIIVSSLEQKNQVVDALEAGAKHYVLKPITPERLLQRINSVLGIIEENITEDTEEENIEEKTEEIEEEDTVKEEPFIITNNSGVFVVRINKSIDSDALKQLNTVMEGLLFIKPLEIIFDFNEIECLEMTIYNNFVDLTKKLFEGEANTKIVVNNKELFKFIVHNTINSYAKIYKDMDEIENEQDKVSDEDI
ncbi:response regulator [Clostridium lundense]|uniref:response regulator n=1 Tax=Clostridium lundense TaxID=319475 RepID=UPI0009FBC00F|nr:response regulator [Clostridium lundense]